MGIYGRTTSVGVQQARFDILHNQPIINTLNWDSADIIAFSHIHMVKGDIPPDLATTHAKQLAKPLHVIYRKVYQTLDWPLRWKTVTVSVIPKVQSPSTMSELRNLP